LAAFVLAFTALQAHQRFIRRKSMDVKTTVSPSLHPANLEAIDGFSDDTKGYINAAVDALSTAYDSLGKIHEAKAAASKNQAFNEHQQVLVVADFAEKHQTLVAQKFDSAVASLTKGIDAMDAMLNGPIKADAERLNVAQEIRAHTKGLSVDERQKFLSDAHDAGDIETLRAVLGAKGYLSGLTEQERQVRTRMLHEKNSPETANRLKVMRAARDMLLQRSGIVFGEVEKALGAKWDKVQQLRKGQSAAENALKFNG
jgi:hypothetical protein